MKGLQSAGQIKRPAPLTRPGHDTEGASFDASSTLLPVAALRQEYDPLLDKSYQATRLGVAVVDFLAYMDLGGARERTLDQYERDLSRGCLMYPNTPLEEWSDAQMLHVAKSFKAKERRVRVAAYKSFFRWAVKARKITMNPCDALPTMKQSPKKVFDLFTEADIVRFTGLSLRDAALFEIMFGAGARKGDCRNFQFRDWRSEATVEAPYGMLVFLDGKGGKDRQVPASERIARRLSELWILDGLKPNDFLWYTRPGGGTRIDRSHPVNDGSFQHWWDRCIKESGVRYRNPHMTRHTFATGFLRNRGRLETLQLILGHESIATTSDLYGHLDMRDVSYDLGLLQEITLE